MHIPPCVGKFFKFMAFTFLEIALNLGITSAPTPPHSKLSPKFLSSLGKGKLLISAGRIRKIYLAQQQKREGREL